jgi:hypothetical protein
MSDSRPFPDAMAQFIPTPATASVEPYVHRCVVRTGVAEGAKVTTEVSEWDVRAAEKCEHCGEILATVEDLVLHLYSELTSQS